MKLKIVNGPLHNYIGLRAENEAEKSYIYSFASQLQNCSDIAFEVTGEGKINIQVKDNEDPACPL